MASLQTLTRTRGDIVLIRDMTPCGLVGRETTIMTSGSGKFLDEMSDRQRSMKGAILVMTSLSGPSLLRC